MTRINLGTIRGHNYPTEPVPRPLDKLALPALMTVGNLAFWLFAVWGRWEFWQ